MFHHTLTKHHTAHHVFDLTQIFESFACFDICDIAGDDLEWISYLKPTYQIRVGVIPRISAVCQRALPSPLMDGMQPHLYHVLRYLIPAGFCSVSSHYAAYTVNPVCAFATHKRHFNIFRITGIPLLALVSFFQPCIIPAV